MPGVLSKGDLLGDMESDKPFPCNVPQCPQSFATEDHLAVHQKKHEMLLLNLGDSKTYIGKISSVPSAWSTNFLHSSGPDSDPNSLHTKLRRSGSIRGLEARKYIR